MNQRKVGCFVNKQYTSNYIVCPHLCPNCTHFSQVKSSAGDYLCDVSKSYGKDPATYFESKRNSQSGYIAKEYDNCDRFEDKYQIQIQELQKKQQSLNVPDDISPAERRRLEREEEKRQEQEEEAEWLRKKEEEERQRQKEEEEIEYERTHCFFCGEKGLLIYFHGKKFHENCLEKFKKSDNGIKWIAEQEKDEKQRKLYLERCDQILAIVKKYGNIFGDPIEEFFRFANRTTDYNNRIVAFLNADINLFSSYVEKCYNEEKARQEKEKLEKEQQEKEAEKLKEEQEKKAKTDKAKNSLQRKIKLPVFIIGLLPIFWAFGTFPPIDRWLPIISLVVIIFIFYKILSGWINSTYDVIEEYKQKGNNPSKGYKFIVYSGVVLVSLAIYFGLLFLIMHILLKVW